MHTQDHLQYEKNGPSNNMSEIDKYLTRWCVHGNLINFLNFIDLSLKEVLSWTVLWILLVLYRDSNEENKL